MEVESSLDAHKVHVNLHQAHKDRTALKRSLGETLTLGSPVANISCPGAFHVYIPRQMTHFLEIRGKVYAVNDEKTILDERMTLDPGHDALRDGPNPNESPELCCGFAPRETLLVEKLRWTALFLHLDMVIVPTRRRTGRDTHGF